MGCLSLSQFEGFFSFFSTFTKKKRHLSFSLFCTLSLSFALSLSSTKNTPSLPEFSLNTLRAKNKHIRERKRRKNASLSHS